MIQTITLNEGATAQETFDRVVTHLRTQGRPAMSIGGTCAYLTAEGLKCAAGCLVPEGSRLQEGTKIISQVDYGMAPLKFPALIGELQRAHDQPTENQRPLSEWAVKCAARCVRVAEDFDLDDSLAAAWLAELSR
jgi:hypothetical protein